MFLRRLLFGSMLLLHAAIALLGNAGLHSALGCHHDHGAGQQCSHSRTPTKHSRCHCKHHQVAGPVAPAPEQHAPLTPPLSDDDCAICQFFARPVEAAAEFQWTLGFELVVTASVEVTQQSGTLWTSVYEVRGPPVLA